MAGEEHRPSLGGDLAHHRLELTLHQRVESCAGLVHDQHRGSVHEGLDESYLLPVAGRQIADLLRQVGIEALGELVDVVPVDAAAQV